MDDDNDGDIDSPPWLVPRVITTFDWVMTTFDWAMTTFDSQLAAQDIGNGFLIYFVERSCKETVALIFYVPERPFMHLTVCC